MIRAQRVDEFKNRLKVLGEIKELPGEASTQEEQVELRIEIMRRSVLP
jgi:hypothetical protein